MEEVKELNETTEEKVVDIDKVLIRVEKEMEKATDTKTYLSLLGHYEKLQDMMIRSIAINNEAYKTDVGKEIEMAKIESNEKIEEIRRDLQETLASRELKASRTNEFIRGAFTIGGAIITGMILLKNNKNNREFVHLLDLMHLNYDKSGFISQISKDDLRTAMNVLDIKARV